MVHTLSCSQIFSETGLQTCLEKGLQFLAVQGQQEFAEATHRMVFPQVQGFISPQEDHQGDIFARALIADTLCDVRDHFGEVWQPLIEREVNYLLSCQRQTGIGGWGYFPNLPELPPDVDDLAQIMQVLLRSRRRAEVEKTCELPLAVLLEDNYYPDGSFETWIIPTDNRTPEQQLQGQWAQLAWGTGPDPDVMANLLYALALYDGERFSQVIEKGVTYLENQQKTDGSWQSSWYHGPFYGTYVCLRLLALVRPLSPSMARGVNFLEASQRGDGGWGVEAMSEPLSTALALLGLAVSQSRETNPVQGDCVSPPSPPTLGGEKRDFLHGDGVFKGLNYLQEYHQQSEQSWPSCRFIRMELGRASGQVRAILFYGSQTITTAFVVKAILAWQ
jgi:squalene-hopene/tetraprenyl-beta-curcumene cyclase